MGPKKVFTVPGAMGPKKRTPIWPVEGCGEEGPLRGIFFAEFHPVRGPIIRCQVPKRKPGEEVIPKNVFDDISAFAIPKAELNGRVMAANVRGYKVMGCGAVLKDPKYKRNAFMFNVCFVCHTWSRSSQYETALLRLSEFLVTLELEREFLSKPAKEKDLRLFLGHIFKELNANGYLKTVFMDFCYESRVVKLRRAPPVIGDHQVPVLMVGTEAHKNWDLTLQQILPYVDGLTHVQRIAQLADVHSGLVKAAVRNLVHLDIARIAPIFQFNNVYRLSMNPGDLLEDERLKKILLEAAKEKPDSETPKFATIFRLICQIGNGTRVKDLCTRFKRRARPPVNMYRLIQTLCIYGVIRVLHMDPFYKRNDSQEQTDFSNSGLTSTQHNRLLALCDGSRSMDEISVAMAISYQKLKAFCDSHNNIFIV